ncbi:MAG: dTDP-4-dehydrorhamnose reductase [Acetobacteraceae bacterium]
MTVLVTGGSGQLAQALGAAAPDLVRVIGRPEFDFDRPETVGRVFDAAVPDLVVNAAAYTAVDAAETDAAAAFRANRDGPAALAALCRTAGVPLIHVSTDYVFDGTKGAPYMESDPVSPQGVYGASKLAGEVAVLESGARAIVVRTSWLYAHTGRNFVRTMLGAARKTRSLRVVADQKGCPTTAADLAAALLAIAARLAAEGWQDRFGGVVHAAGTGWTNWHGLAVAAFEEAARYGAPVPEVAAIRTEDWPTPARRPADSRLDCARLAAVFGVALPPWRDGLRRTIDALAAAGELSG